jgi:hypothetical protein
MVLGMVVSEIFWAGSPIDDKLALADTVFDPITAHVDGFGPLFALVWLVAYGPVQ